MKAYFTILCAFVITLFSATSFAFTPPAAPQNGWYVSDQTGRMTADQIAQLNSKIDQISKTTKNEFAILLLPNMDGSSIEDVASSTFKAWGVGKHGLDNGILLVVSLQERKSRIETGKGVEGEVTDLQANDILKKNLNPHLKTGDFAGGFNESLDALSTLIESRHNQAATPVAPVVAQTVDDSAIDNVIVAFVVGGLALVGCFIAFFVFVSNRNEARRRRAEEERERIARKYRARELQDSLTTKTSLPAVTPVVVPTPAPSYNYQTSSYQRTTPKPKKKESSPPRRSSSSSSSRSSSSSSSSSSSFDWGSSSSSSSDSGGGGFGGGDSGGGGSSSDW